MKLVYMVRKEDKLKVTPILMITSNSAGVNNYIVKPFTADTLKGKILSVIPSAC